MDRTESMNPNDGTEHYVSREDGQVYYFRVGRGKPLTLLHAVGLSGWTWRSVIPILAEHFTCYNIDMPGFDHSGVPPRKYAIEDFTRAVLDVLDAAGVDRTSIVADRTGSIVSVDLAGSHPQRVDRMVLDGLPYWNVESGRAYFESYFLPQYTDRTSFDVPVAPFLTWEEAAAQNPTNLDRELWQKREEIKGKSRLWTRLCQEVNTSYDVEAAGPGVKAPTLLVYGQNDYLQYGGETAARGMEGSALKLVPEAPGAVHQHQPEEFARIALEFLW